MNEDNEKEIDPIMDTEKVIEPEIMTNEEEKKADVVSVVEEKKENETEVKSSISEDKKKEKSAREMAIVSLVFGIIAVTIGCCNSYIGLGSGIAAIVLGVMANKKFKTGMATAGFILGIISCSFFVLYIVAIIIFGAAAFTGALNSLYY